MAQPMRSKGGGEGDGHDPKGPAAESAHQLQELSAADHLARYIEQDQNDGVEDDQLSILKQYENEGKPEQQIFDAVEKGAAGKLDKLLSKGFCSPDCRDAQGRTPLIVAAEAGNAALAGVLLPHSADVNAVDADGETGLMKAAFGGHLDVLELLVSKGAVLDIRNNEDFSALEIAQEMEHEAVVAFLSEQSDGSTSSIGTETSAAPDEDESTVDSSATTQAVPSPVTQLDVPDHDSDAVFEVGKSPDLEAQREPETMGDYQEETAHGPSPDKEFLLPAQGQADEARIRTSGPHDAVLEQKGETRPDLAHSVIAASDKRIEFDALDNKQVRSINEKVIKVLDKAGREVGDHVIDTVFKGSYMAVLKPRSQENKRLRKLKKHPELVIDPKRLTELTGGCAARRLCLAEGKDISHLTISHFIELYYAKDPKLILTLAEDAVIHNYTVRQLKQAVEELREHKDDHDPGKEIIRTLDQPVPILEDPDLMALCTDKDRVLDELSKAERRKIRALIKARKPGLDEWKNLMDTFEGILSDLEDD